jgi:hypothetical protein
MISIPKRMRMGTALPHVSGGGPYGIRGRIPRHDLPGVRGQGLMSAYAPDPWSLVPGYLKYHCAAFQLWANEVLVVFLFARLLRYISIFRR